MYYNNDNSCYDYNKLLLLLVIISTYSCEFQIIVK